MHIEYFVVVVLQWLILLCSTGSKVCCTSVSLLLGEKQSVSVLSAWKVLCVKLLDFSLGGLRIRLKDFVLHLQLLKWVDVVQGPGLIILSLMTAIPVNVPA